MFRALVYSRKNLTDGAIANIDISSAQINEDLTQKASSSFNCYKVPKDISQNDILRVYNTRGKFSYWGVINSVSKDGIDCNQFQSLFNDQILLKKMSDSSTQKNYFKSLTISDFAKFVMNAKIKGYYSTAHDGHIYTDDIDADVANSYAGISISTHDEGFEHYPYPTENDTINIESLLYDLFNTYNRIIIPMWYDQPTARLITAANENIKTEDNNFLTVYKRLGIAEQHINILACNVLDAYGQPAGIVKCENGDIYDFSERTLFDSYENITNLSVINEDEDVNTVHVYYRDLNNGARRRSYTVDTNGEIKQIQNLTPVEDRLGVNKTSYIFDDDTDDLDLEDLVKRELPTQQFNHKITFDITFNENNRFSQYNLGQPIRFYDSNSNWDPKTESREPYKSILTGRSYTIEENSDEIKNATFTLGKVRSSLTAKLQKEKRR